MTRRDVGTLGRQPHVTQHFESAQKYGQRRTAGGNTFEVRLAKPRRWRFDEALHELVVVLAGISSKQLA
jgi:hypothetical protein